MTCDLPCDWFFFVFFFWWLVSFGNGWKSSVTDEQCIVKCGQSERNSCEDSPKYVIVVNLLAFEFGVNDSDLVIPFWTTVTDLKSFQQKLGHLAQTEDSGRLHKTLRIYHRLICTYRLLEIDESFPKIGSNRRKSTKNRHLELFVFSWHQNWVNSTTNQSLSQLNKNFAKLFFCENRQIL